MDFHSKRVLNIKNNFSVSEALPIDEGLELLLDCATKNPVKFIESVDVSFGLGIDSKKGDQVVKGFVELPHGNGRKVNVLVFADDNDNIEKATKAGAKYVGSDDLIDQVFSGKIADFDKCVATPSMMPKIAKLARILGPKGMMPNPKLGTVAQDLSVVVSSFMKGRIDIRTDKEGYVKLSVGKVNFDVQKIKENILEVVNVLKNVKPATVKSNYFKSLFISTTMGFGLRIKLSDL